MPPISPKPKKSCLGIAWHTYTLEYLYLCLRIVSAHPKNPECYYLLSILAHPKFSHLEGEFDVYQRPLNTAKFIRCREHAPVTTQLQKFGGAFISRLVPPSCKLLEWNCQNEGKHRELYHLC